MVRLLTTTVMIDKTNDVHLYPCTTTGIPDHRLTQAMYDAKEPSL
jgi:hypothetical protein